MSVAPIDRPSLSFDRMLGGGSFGKVYAVATPGGLVADPVCAYKELNNVEPHEPDNLNVLIEFRDSLSAAERGLLDTITAWPLAAVTDRGKFTGYLMRLVPDDYFEHEIMQLGEPPASEPRNLGWLISPALTTTANVRQAVDADDLATRFHLCAWISYIFAFLHKHGITYGDINEKNLLYRLDASPPIVVVDIDPARAENKSPIFEQPHQPHMKPHENQGPSASPVQDEFTDRYKLAYLCLQILGCARSFSDLRPLAGKVDIDGIALFRRALNPNRHSRPSAKEWYEYYYRQHNSLIAPPTIRSFDVSSNAGIQGQTITVSWDVEGHETLVLISPSGDRYSINRSATRSLQVPLTTTGDFRLVAENRYGTAEQLSDVVYVFTPPQIEFVSVPIPGDVAGGLPMADLSALSRAIVDVHDLAGLRTDLDVGPSLALPDVNLGQILTPPRLDSIAVAPPIDILP